MLSTVRKHRAEIVEIVRRRLFVLARHGRFPSAKQSRVNNRRA